MKTKFIFSLIVSIFLACLSASAVVTVIPELSFLPTAGVLFGAGIVINTMFPHLAMEVLVPGDLTFNGEEVKSLSEAIQEEVYAKPGLNEFHTIETGIKAKKQIALLGRLNKLLGRKHTNGQCAPTENDAKIRFSEKFWLPQFIEDRLVECWDNLLETFFIYGTNNGINKPDLSKTDFADFLIDRVGDELLESIFRYAWFSDVDAAAYNASPAGVFLDAGPDYVFDAGNWNAIDGFWKQIFTIAAGTPARRVVIARNAQLTFALQQFDSTDTTNRVVTKLLQDLIFNADYRLRDKANKIIIVTQSVADQYVRELEDAAGNGIPVAFEFITDGVSKLTRMGVTIYAFSFWDRIITTYTRNSAGTGYDNPHRALLTVKENLRIGTEEEADLAKLEPFYDQTLKKYFIDLGYNIDAKVIEDYKIQVGY